MSQLRRREAQHLAAIDLDHCVESCGMRLDHSPESGFRQFNHPVIMEDEIEVGIETKTVQRRQRGS
jgi:hypothetical protein